RGRFRDHRAFGGSALPLLRDAACGNGGPPRRHRVGTCHPLASRHPVAAVPAWHGGETRVKIDTHLGMDLSEAAERARTLEQQGFDGLISVETQHDPFLPLVVAAEHT